MPELDVSVASNTPDLVTLNIDLQYSLAEMCYTLVISNNEMPFSFSF